MKRQNTQMVPKSRKRARETVGIRRGAVALALLMSAGVAAGAGYAAFSASGETTRNTFTIQAGQEEGKIDNDEDNGTGSPVGTITDIQYTDCTIPSSKVDGTYVMATVDERLNVTLTVQATGRVDQQSGRTYINRTIEVAVGQSVDYLTKACMFTGTVSQLQ